MARKFIGKVVSDVMDKTVVVNVERMKEHPIYRKKYQASVRLMAHDENNQSKVGDLVEITETRPKSKRKRWEVTATIGSDKGGQ